MSVLLLTMGPQLGITAELPVVGVGGAGVIRFRPIGASGPVKWMLVDSTLPAEWDSALNPDGNAVTLTTSDAETAGTFRVTVRAVDNARIPVVRSFDVRVMALPLTILGAFPEWSTGLPATGALTISGGVPPYSGLAITSGALPAGVSLSIVGDQIVASGSPTVSGPWAATLRASDSAETTAEISVTGTVARLWTPADLSVAPKIWLDWDSELTDVAGHVSEWRNKGSLGGVFSQTTPSSRPALLSAELNGKRVIRFDGVNDGLRSTSVSGVMAGVNAGESFMVCRLRANSSPVAVLSITDSASPISGSRHTVGVGHTGPGRFNLLSRRLDTGDENTLADPAPSVGSWIMRHSLSSYSTGTASTYVNGSLAMHAAAAYVPPGQSGGAAFRAVMIGAWVDLHNNPEFPAQVDIALLIVCSGVAISVADRQRLEGWAAWQCGLQASLPSGHPYRHAPPVLDQNP